MAHNRDEIERTEAPSPRWLAHARERGVWPRSNELTVACSLLAGVLLLRFATGPLIDSFLEVLRHCLTATDTAGSVGLLQVNWIALSTLFCPLSCLLLPFPFDIYRMCAIIRILTCLLLRLQLTPISTTPTC